MYETTTDRESRSSWLNEKPNSSLDFPNLPYFVDTDGFQITESSAIHVYIAEKWMPELLGSTPEERALVEQIRGKLNDVKKAIFSPCFTGEKNEAEMIESMYEQASTLSQYLNEKQFIIGDKLCYVDFQIFECLKIMALLTKHQLWEMYPNLEDYKNRIADIPNVKKFLETDPSEKLPFIMRFARRDRKSVV